MSFLILMDITRLLGRQRIDTPTGIDRVEFQYVDYLLAHHADTTRFVVRFRGHTRVVSRRSVANFIQLLDRHWTSGGSAAVRQTCLAIRKFIPGIEIGDFDSANSARDGRIFSRKLWRAKLRMMSSSRQIRAAALKRHDVIYLNVSHEGLHYDRDIVQLVEAAGVKPVFFIHDLIPITHPEYVKKGRTGRHHQRMNTMLRYGHALIGNSDHTARTMRDYAKDYGLPEPRMTVAKLGPSVRLSDGIVPPFDTTPFFVTLGTIEPRKNHILLLQLWRQMVETIGDTAPKLLIIGRRGWENENAIDLIERCPTVRSHVLECAYVNDEVLRSLIVRSRAMLFPSFAEGYGMPRVESLANGTPVIASDLAVFREIANDAPDYLDPLDGPGWRSQIEGYAQPVSPLRDRQIQRIGSVDIPTWQQHFSAVEPLLH